MVELEYREFQAEATDFVMVFILKMTYAQLTKVARRKNVTVSHVIAEALAKQLAEEEAKS